LDKVENKLPSKNSLLFSYDQERAYKPNNKLHDPWKSNYYFTKNFTTGISLGYLTAQKNKLDFAK